MTSRIIGLVALGLIAGCDRAESPTPAATSPPTIASTTSARADTTAAAVSTTPIVETGPVGLGKPLTVGHMRVTIRKATIGKVPLKAIDGSIEYSPEVRLMLSVRIENTSDKRPSNYSTWGPDLDAAKTFAKLKDDAGNELTRIKFGFGNNVKDRTVLDTINPGKAINDLLVFETPPANAKYLDLELPGNNCGVRGEFRYRIEIKDIAR
jgi:hypothetical protein